MTVHHSLTITRERGRHPWHARCACGQFATRRRLRKSVVSAYHRHTAKAAHATGHDPGPVDLTPVERLPEQLR